MWRSDNYTGLFRREDLEVEENNLIKNENKIADLMFKKMMDYYYNINEKIGLIQKKIVEN